jgi:hypothetical protein
VPIFNWSQGINQYLIVPFGDGGGRGAGGEGRPPCVPNISICVYYDELARSKRRCDRTYAALAKSVCNSANLVFPCE